MRHPYHKSAHGAHVEGVFFPGGPEPSPAISAAALDRPKPRPGPLRPISKDTFPSPRLLALDLEAAALGYPAGTGSVTILRSMPPNSRRVR
jgi:hypothetical protein